MNLLTHFPLNFPLVSTLIRKRGALYMAMRSSLRLLIKAWATAYNVLLIYRPLDRSSVPCLGVYLLLVMLLLWHGKEAFVCRLTCFHRHRHQLLSGWYLLLCMVKVVLLYWYCSILFVLRLVAGFTSLCLPLLLLINLAHLDEPSVGLWLGSSLSLLNEMTILFNTWWFVNLLQFVVYICWLLKMPNIDLSLLNSRSSSGILTLELFLW